MQLYLRFFERFSRLVLGLCLVMAITACGSRSTRLLGTTQPGHLECRVEASKFMDQSLVDGSGSLRTPPAFPVSLSASVDNKRVSFQISSVQSNNSGGMVGIALPSQKASEHAANYVAQALGRHSVTFNILNASDARPASCIVEFTVTETPILLQRLSLSAPPASIPRGNSINLTATGFYSDGSSRDVTAEATWSSSNATIAEVSDTTNKGRVTARSLGSATITAQLSGVSASATVSIVDAELRSIRISPATASIAKGLSQSFQAFGTYTDRDNVDITQSVVWVSSQPTIASIGNTAGTKGMATGLAVGETNISAVLGNVTSSPSTLRITQAVARSLRFVPETLSLGIGQTGTIRVIAELTDGSLTDYNNNGNWTSSAPAIGTVSNTSAPKGLATGVAVGQTTLTFSDGILTKTATLTVVTSQLVSLAISPPNPSLLLGQTMNLTVAGTYSDGTVRDLTQTAQWSTNAMFMVSVGNTSPTKGVIVAEGPGDCAINASVDGIIKTVTVRVPAKELYFYHSWAGDGDFTLNQILGSTHPFEAYNFRTKRFKVFVIERLLSRINFDGKDGYAASDISVNVSNAFFARITRINRHMADRTSAESAANSSCTGVADDVFGDTFVDYQTVKQAAFLNLSTYSGSVYLFSDQQRDRWAIAGQGCYPSIHSSGVYRTGAVVAAPTFSGSPWSSDGFSNTYGNGAYVYIDAAGAMHLQYRTQAQASRVVFLIGIVGDP